jgi:spore coat polysaccharide biosynthesis protein SpsF
MGDKIMTALIVQARLDSSRLPNKALLPLEDEPTIFRVMQALSTLKCDVRILACPEDSYAAFAPFAKRAKFKIFAGDKENVLGRFCDAIRYFEIDKHKDARIIRATGDNPFVFADAAIKINKDASIIGADYAGYASIPCGAGVESVSVEALLKIEKKQLLPAEREHVCPHFYGNPSAYKLHRPLSPKKWQHPEISITVDTPEDYEMAKLLYSELKKTSARKRHNGETIIKCLQSITQCTSTTMYF